MTVKSVRKIENKTVDKIMWFKTEHNIARQPLIIYLQPSAATCTSLDDANSIARSSYYTLF